MSAEMQVLTEALATKSAKIRALDAAGYSRSEIAKFLNIRYQHVRNVLVQPPPKALGRAASDRPGSDSSAAEREDMKVQVGPGGRIVIPANVREAMGVGEGTVLYARLENGEFTLSTPDAVVKRVQAALRQYLPEGVSLVDELIADRRREAAKEEEDG